MPTSTTIHSISIAMSVKVDVPEKVLEIDAEAYAAANDIQKTIMIIQAGVSPDKAASVVQELNKLFAQPAPQTAPTANADPFAVISQATTAATQAVYNLELVAAFVKAIKAFGPDAARLRQILRDEMRNKGLQFVKDPWLSQLLVQWINVNPQAGGQIMLNPNPARGIHNPLIIQIIAEEQRNQAWTQLMRLVERSKLDNVLQSAAAYHRAKATADAKKLTGAQVVTDLQGVNDPDSIRVEVEQLLAEITQLMGQGIIGPTTDMMAAELAYIVLAAMQDRGVVTSLGVPMDPTENANPLQAFLNYPGNQHQQAVAALRFTGAAGSALDVLARYDASQDFGAYLMQLGAPGQQYSMAVRDFAGYSPEPLQVEPGRFVGITHAAKSFMAMLSVNVKVGNTSVQVDLSVATRSAGPVPYENTGDLRVLSYYLDAQEARELAQGLMYPHGYTMTFTSVDNVQRQVMSENEAEWARRILERHPEVVWKSQMIAALKRLSMDDVKTTATAAGIDVDSLQTSTKTALISDLIDHALRRGLWLYLINEVRKQNVL